MKREIIKSLNEWRCIVAYLDSFSLRRDLRQARLVSHKGMVSLRELQFATGEEVLDENIPESYDRLTFKQVGDRICSLIFDRASQGLAWGS